MIIKQVDRRRNLSSEDFLNEYFNTDTPVILEDAVSTWWPQALQKWSIDYLTDQLGDRIVDVRKNTSTIDYKLGKRYLLAKIPFSKYAFWHKNNMPERYDHYLAVNNIKAAFPEISPHIPLPDHVGKLHAGPYLWIAPDGHYEYTHVDAHDNFCAIIRGRKNFRIFSTGDFDKLYPHDFGSKGKTVQSRVHLDNIDYELYPKMRQAVCMEADIGQGDVVFVPSLFWHQVTTIDPCTISVNIFFGPRGDDQYIKKMLTNPRSDAFRHWILNVIVQNKDAPSFDHLIEEDLPGSIKNFLFKQYHEHCTDQQIEQIVSWVRDYFKQEHGIEHSLVTSEKGAARKHPRQLKIRGLSWRS
ncbi:lysine-specific demethylase [Acrasis kona]|uniref:Lysine-specific demethylase n=1 Tax=Acrasis kona TaxID=1008807 RepID=A0AAW2YWK1_9EUKA